MRPESLLFSNPLAVPDELSDEVALGGIDDMVNMHRELASGFGSLHLPTKVFKRKTMMAKARAKYPKLKFVDGGAG